MIKEKKRYDLILPSLTETYTNAFIVADRVEKVYIKPDEQNLRVPGSTTMELKRIRRKSEESIQSITMNLNEDHTAFDDQFQESRVYATLHALCLHSLVKRFFL